MDSGNYNEAIQDKDATLWQRAMNTGMESMYSNQVWTVVDPAVGRSEERRVGKECRPDWNTYTPF